MSCLTTANSCFLLPLLALSGFCGGTVTQTYRASGLPLSGQPDDWINDTSIYISEKNDTGRSLNVEEESFDLNQASFTHQKLNSATEELKDTTPIESPVSLEEQFSTAGSTEYDSDRITDFPGDNPTTILDEQEADNLEPFTLEKDIEKAGHDDLHHNRRFGLGVELKMDSDGEVDSTNDPARVTTTRVMKSADLKSITNDNPSVLQASTIVSRVDERGSDQKFPRDLSAKLHGLLNSTNVTSLHYDGESYETVDNLSNETPTTDIGENTRFAVVAQNSTIIEEESGGFESELKWKDRNRSSGSTTTSTTGNSISLDDQRPPMVYEVEVPNRKWNKTRESYADLLDGVTKKRINRKEVFDGLLTGKIGDAKQFKNRKDIEDVGERIIAHEPSRRFLEFLTDSKPSSTLNVDMDKAKRPALDLVQILKDAIGMETQRLKADNTLLKAINELIMKATAVYNESVSESCRRNSDKEAANQHAGIAWNPPWNRSFLNIASIPRALSKIPPETGFTKFLPRSVLGSAGAYRDDRMSLNIAHLASGELFRQNPTFWLPGFPDGRTYEDADFSSSDTLLHDDMAVSHKIISSLVECTRVCHKTEITPSMICKRRKVRCSQDYNGDPNYCRSSRIVCRKNYFKIQPNQTKLICKNILTPVENSKVGTTVLGLFLLGRPCNMEQESMLRWYPQWKSEVEQYEEYVLPFTKASGLEEVEKVYGNQTATEWVVGVLKGKSSLQEVMGNLSIPDDPNFVKSSYSIDMPAGPTSEAHMAQSPEVVEKVLLEAIRRVIRDDKNSVSKNPVLLPHLDIIKIPTTSTGSNIDDRKGFTDKSTSSTVTTMKNLVTSYLNKINPAGNDKNSGNIRADQDYVNVTSTTDSSDIINMAAQMLDKLSNELPNLNANNRHEQITNDGIPMNMRDDPKMKSISNTDFETTIDLAEGGNKIVTPEPAVLIVPTEKTEVIPVEPQPVAVTDDEQQSSETTPPGDIVETSIALSPVYTHRSDVSSVSVNSPLRFDVDTVSNEASNNPIDTVQGIIRRVSAGLFDYSGNNINANRGNNFDEHRDNNHNNRRESNPNATLVLPPIGNDNVYFRRNAIGQHQNLPRNLGIFPIHQTVEHPSSMTTNNIVVNGEQYGNLETNRNANVSVNHNANFNQGIVEEVQSEASRGEPIKIAEPAELKVQQPDRSLRPREDTASVASFIVNSRGDVRDTTDENHRFNLTTNVKATSEILENPTTRMLGLTVNRSPESDGAAAKIGSTVNSHHNESPPFTINQSGYVNGKANSQQRTAGNAGIVVSVIHGSTLNLSRISSLDSNENRMSTDTKMIDNRTTNPHSNYNPHQEQKVDGHTNSKVVLNASFETGLPNIIRAIAGRAVNAIVAQSPLNSVNSIRATEAPRTIINANSMIADALNSVGSIGSGSLNGAVSLVQQPAQALSMGSNQPAADPNRMLGVLSASVGNTDSPNGQHHQQIINTNYNSNLNYNSDSNYNSNRNDNAKVVKVKVTSPFSSQNASSGINKSTDNNTKRERGWYELWYNSGGEDKNGWTEIWNNKKFKRFLEQQLQQLKDDEIGKDREDNTTTSVRV